MNKACHIEIDIGTQRLRLYAGGKFIREYSISTAKNGPGELQDSECTPRGEHVIAEKIGADSPLNTVFVSRRSTGETFTPELRQRFPDRDWILTRILWLQGTEPGKNLGGNVDSHGRFIYIHGAPDDVAMGRPGSRGCIRMRNQDIIELFEDVEPGTRVVLT
jgi:L,D-transpeptidase YbiS